MNFSEISDLTLPAMMDNRKWVLEHWTDEGDKNWLTIDLNYIMQYFTDF